MIRLLLGCPRAPGRVGILKGCFLLFLELLKGATLRVYISYSPLASETLLSQDMRLIHDMLADFCVSEGSMKQYQRCEEPVLHVFCILSSCVGGKGLRVQELRV